MHHSALSPYQHRPHSCCCLLKPGPNSAKSTQLRQQQARMVEPAAVSSCDDVPPAAAELESPPLIHSWTKAMREAYISQCRDWQAVEDLYMRIVAGQDCLSSIGLSPAGQPPPGILPDQQQQQQACQQQQVVQETAPPPQLAQQQQGATGSLVQESKQQRNRHQRVTYKLQVSYLGSAFNGWQGGHAEDRPSGVQGALAQAIAATGLCQLPGGGASKAKRLAKRAVQKAYALQLAAATAAGAAQHTADAADGTANTTSPRLQQHSGQADSHTEAAAGAGGAQQTAEQGAQQSVGGKQDAAQAPVPFLNCAGRTDAGVSAVGQVAAFYSWQPFVPEATLVNMINTQLQLQWAAATGSCSSSSHAGDSLLSAQQQQQRCPPLCPVRVWQAEQVPRQWHPTFHATWRRYVYLFPLRTPHTGAAVPHAGLAITPPQDLQQTSGLTAQQQQAVQAAPDVDPALVNAMLQHLQGRRLNFYAFARDTPQGKDCECTLLLARATLVWIPCRHAAAACSQPQPAALEDAAAAEGGGAQRPCMAVELVADRFLRKMVRVLVGTAVREAVAAKQQHRSGAASCPTDQLLQLVHRIDRRATATAAPALGLCFAAVGYD